MMKEKRTGISRAEAEGRMGIKGKRNTGGKKFGPAVRKPPGSTDGIGLIAALPRETDIFVWFQSFGYSSSYFEVFPIDFRSGPFDQAKRVARWAKKSLFISTPRFFFFVSSPVARPVEFGVHRCGINGSIVTTRQLDNL